MGVTDPTDPCRVLTFCPAGRPSAPALLELVGVTEDSVTLSWLSPERDGGSRIFRYVVEMRDISAPGGWLKVKEVDSSDILVACIEGLREGHPYMFRVYAENKVGAGVPTELRESIVPRSQIGKSDLASVTGLEKTGC